MEARLKEKLPQEGTGDAGESVPELSSGCPAYSGGGKVVLSVEKPTKTLTQQLFHPGLFNRQRSASLGDARELIKKHNDKQQEKLNEQENNVTDLHNPNIPWQRMPNQKRNRSPEENSLSKSNEAKRLHTRNQLISQNRDITESTSRQSPEIETSNRYSILDVEADDSALQKKTPKPPPIILYGIEDLAKLTELIEQVLEKNDYTFKVSSKDQLIISSATIDKYKILIEHIRARGLIGHTFTRKDQKCMRIVIKHLHFSTPKDAIIDAIEKTGNKVQGEIVTARKPGTKEPLNTFFVNVASHENNKRVKDIKFIYHQKVKIEDPKRKTTIVQCTRCQQYGHSKNYCMRPYRCVKCAGPHKTTLCTIDKNTPAVCTLCSGSHPASYKGCMVYKEILTRKKMANKPNTKYKINSLATKDPTVYSDTQIETEKERKVKTTKQHATVQESLKQYSEVVKKGLENSSLKNHTYDPIKYKKDTQDHQTSWPLDNSTETQRSDIYINRHQPRTQKPMTKYNDDNMSQRTQLKKIDSDNDTREQIRMLEKVITRQSERIDQLITQLNTMMNLIITLVSKAP